MAGVLHGLAIKLTRTSSVCYGCVWTQYRAVNTVSVFTRARPATAAASINYGQLTWTRSVSFVSKDVTASDLWGGVYGVSNAGRKRGRAKKHKKPIDLNRGQVIGVGENNIVWPGLNAPVVKGRERLTIQPLPPDPERETRIREMRERGNQPRWQKTPALQRGWSGAKLGGMSIGPPDPVGDYKFEGFDSRVLEFKKVANMTANLGRKMQFSAFVVTGNKQGLAGFGLAKAAKGKSALRKAKNMAAQRLQYIERFEDHTVYHNFHSREKQTAIFVYKKAKGSGLLCHRAVKTMCEIIGIEDMAAKVEGNTDNIQNLTKAFFAGLVKQETHQELADRVGLHVVEIRSEMDNVPIVVASPAEGKTKEKGITQQDFDFETLYYGKDKLPLYRPKPPPFYHKQQSWRIKQRNVMKMRNQKEAQLQRRALGLEPSPEEMNLRQKPLR